MITTTIHRVGQSYRVKFTGHRLRNGALLDGYFAADELDELRVAVQRAKARIQELSRDSGQVESADDLFGRYQERLQTIVPAPE